MLQLATKGPHGRRILLLELAKASDWPTDWVPRSEHFALLLVWATEKSQESIDREFATDLSRLGLALLACWGPGSEQVHDFFDEILAGASLRSADDVVLTTWHQGETLEEALRYFVVTALPTDAYQDSCETWIIATLGEPSLKSRIVSSV